MDELEVIQGNLKDLSEENYTKLKKEILELGFSSPIHVWLSSGKKFVLDGTQRTKTLKKMRTDGFFIPRLPIVEIEANDVKEAKKKVLALTSQYGEITSQGLYEFMAEADLQMPEVEDSFRFPEVDFESFKSNFFAEAPSIEDFKYKDVDKKIKFYTCPYCEKEFEEKQAALRVED